MKNTCIDRRAENKNSVVEDRVLDILNQTKGGNTGNQEESVTNKVARAKKIRTREDIIPSERTKKKATQLLGKIMQDNPESLLHRVTIQGGKQELNLPSKLRVGRPRTCWLIETAKEAWQKMEILKKRKDPKLKRAISITKTAKWWKG